ncbi:MAG TPA: transglycosylase SLT domain-containing protein [Alicyclobacillus sp.]|nr:transglycosylase SLT domain-containing protein [Alicyclobacillus sp.]
MKAKKWATIGLVGIGGLFLLMAAVVGAGAGAGALQSNEPLVPVSADQKKQDQQIANRWEDDQHLTADQRKQVHDLGIELSHGLLEAIWEFTQIPVEKSAEALKPEDVKFQDMDKTIVKEIHVDNGKVIRIETHETVSKLVQAQTYNGVHKIKYKMQTTVQNGWENGYPVTITITEPVPDGEDWQKDYSRINNFLRQYGFLTKEDRLLIYRQAIAYDPNFGDPEAQDILLEEIGGGLPAGTVPQPLPLPPEEITKALQEAIRLTGVNEAQWLPDLQWLVMRESGGDAHAHNPTPVFYSAAWGYQHAEGLLQLMPPTFFAHKMAGHEDIWNPVDNAIAAIDYIKGKYGTPRGIPNFGTAAYVGY